MRSFNNLNGIKKLTNLCGVLSLAALATFTTGCMTNTVKENQISSPKNYITGLASIFTSAIPIEESLIEDNTNIETEEETDINPDMVYIEELEAEREEHIEDPNIRAVLQQTFYRLSLAHFALKYPPKEFPYLWHKIHYFSARYLPKYELKPGEQFNKEYDLSYLKGWKRSGSYLLPMLDILKNKPYLISLTMQESAFSQAMSPTWAAGPNQFMPYSSIKHSSLECLSPGVDCRWGEITSTFMMLSHINESDKLGIPEASYNGGINGVSRHIKRHKGYDNWLESENGNSQSRYYLPQAISKILNASISPDITNIGVPHTRDTDFIMPKPQTFTYTIPYKMSIRDLARIHHTSVDSIIKNNGEKTTFLPGEQVTIANLKMLFDTQYNYTTYSVKRGGYIDDVVGIMQKQHPFITTANVVAYNVEYNDSFNNRRTISRRDTWIRYRNHHSFRGKIDGNRSKKRYYKIYAGEKIMIPTIEIKSPTSHEIAKALMSILSNQGKQITIEETLSILKDYNKHIATQIWDQNLSIPNAPLAFPSHTGEEMLKFLQTTGFFNTDSYDFYKANGYREETKKHLYTALGFDSYIAELDNKLESAIIYIRTKIYPKIEANKKVDHTHIENIKNVLHDILHAYNVIIAENPAQEIYLITTKTLIQDTIERLYAYSLENNSYGNKNFTKEINYINSITHSKTHKRNAGNFYKILANAFNKIKTLKSNAKNKDEYIAILLAEEKLTIKTLAYIEKLKAWKWTKTTTKFLTILQNTENQQDNIILSSVLKQSINIPNLSEIKPILTSQKPDNSLPIEGDLLTLPDGVSIDLSAKPKNYSDLNSTPEGQSILKYIMEHNKSITIRKGDSVSKIVTLLDSKFRSKYRVNFDRKALSISPDKYIPTNNNIKVGQKLYIYFPTLENPSKPTASPKTSFTKAKDTTKPITKNGNVISPEIEKNIESLKHIVKKGENGVIIAKKLTKIIHKKFGYTDIKIGYKMLKKITSSGKKISVREIRPGDTVIIDL